MIGHVLAQAGLPPGGDIDGGEAEHRQTQQALTPAPAKPCSWPRTSNSRHFVPLAATQGVPGQLGRMAGTGGPRDPVAESRLPQGASEAGKSGAHSPPPGVRGWQITTIFPNGHGAPVAGHASSAPGSGCCPDRGRP